MVSRMNSIFDRPSLGYVVFEIVPKPVQSISSGEKPVSTGTKNTCEGHNT